MKIKLKDRMKIYAILDIVFSEEWEYRYFLYYPDWDIKKEEELGAIKNNEGDEVYILFNKKKFFGKIYNDKEKQCLKEYPEAYKNFLSEPAFLSEKISYLFYGENNEIKEFFPKRKKSLLEILLDDGLYIKWINDYYEINVNKEIILKLIKNNIKINKEIALKINKNCNWNSIEDEINKIQNSL